MKKIINTTDAKKVFLKLKKKKKKLVLCHGVFDLLHLGHITHLEKAKLLGDVLIVSITGDKFVNKGPGRPVFNQVDRAKVISSLKIVDFVIIDNNATAIKLFSIIKPNFYCKGSDYKNHDDDITGEIKNEITALKKVGGKIVYTDGQVFSSSTLFNQFSEIFSKKQKKFLSKISSNNDLSKITQKFDKINKFNVLVVGEAIIDEYVFCDALGKSGKEPVLALKEIKSERYLGGSLAIARNISEFCNKVKVVTNLGQEKNYIKFIKSKLNKNIQLDFMNKENSSTILKKRFVDYISLNKILGVYNFNDEPLNHKEDKRLRDVLIKEIPKFDLVIVSDYGHGMISEKNAKIICEKAKFLAVNAQINSSNIGFHSMKKYKKFKCLVINEKELRHEFRDRKSDLKKLSKILSKNQKIENLVVTSGKKGALLYNFNEKKFEYSDALAKKVIDKIGAGDSMLGLISLALASGIEKPLSLLIGSLAAAYSTENIANKDPITKTKMLKGLLHLLK